MKDIVAIHHLRISVEPQGILVMLFKYATKPTGKNYLPVTLTDPLESQGFYRLSARIKPDEIMRVQRVGMWDKTCHVDREIYFLDGQLAEAKQKVIADLTETITRMKTQMDQLHDAWTTKKERPKRKNEHA